MRTKLMSMRILGSAAALVLATAGFAVAQQPPMEGKTAEQVYKNIKVLNGMPAEQLNPDMRVIARDLGVTCEFCHDAKDRSLDTMDAKETARSMITMMRNINKNSFDGRTEVACVTCHNGHSDPANMPTLPPFAVAMLGPGDEVKPPTLPSIDQVLAKYVQALGGEQALRKVTSISITGKRQNYQPGADAVPPPFAVEMYSKAPNLSVVMGHQANGVASNGFDGTAPWTQTPQGRVAQLAGVPASRAKRDADFYLALNMKQQYPRLAVREIEKIGDRDTYVVVAVPQGESAERFYFDTQTGLLLRHQTILVTTLGDVPYAIDYENYRDAGNGVKIPFTVHYVGPARPDCATITVEKVQLNAALDDSKFAKPQAKN